MNLQSNRSAKHESLVPEWSNEQSVRNNHGAVPCDCITAISPRVGETLKCDLP
jgi:hypothetical protein